MKNILINKNNKNERAELIITNASMVRIAHYLNDKIIEEYEITIPRRLRAELKSLKTVDQLYTFISLNNICKFDSKK